MVAYQIILQRFCMLIIGGFKDVRNAFSSKGMLLGFRKWVAGKGHDRSDSIIASDTVGS